MAAHNSSGVAQYVTALTVVPLSVISTKRTTTWSRNTIAITLPADLSILNYLDHGDPVCCQTLLARFVYGSDGEPTSHLH